MFQHQKMLHKTYKRNYEKLFMKIILNSIMETKVLYENNNTNRIKDCMMMSLYSMLEDV